MTDRETLRAARLYIAANLVEQDVRAVYGDSTADYVAESMRQHFDRAALLAEHPAPERQGGVKRWISDREYVIEPDDESAAAHQPSDYVPEPPDWVACACGLDCDPRDPDHLGHRADHPAAEPPRGDHPYVDPGDGRTECYLCGKFVHDVTHSCKGVPVTRAAEARVRGLIDAVRNTHEPPSGGDCASGGAGDANLSAGRAEKVTAKELARTIWHTSRADESTISATGANIVAAAILARYDVRSKP